MSGVLARIQLAIFSAVWWGVSLTLLVLLIHGRSELNHRRAEAAAGRAAAVRLVVTVK